MKPYLFLVYAAVLASQPLHAGTPERQTSAEEISRSKDDVALDYFAAVHTLELASPLCQARKTGSGAEMRSLIDSIHADAKAETVYRLGKAQYDQGRRPENFERLVVQDIAAKDKQRDSLSRQEVEEFCESTLGATGLLLMFMEKELKQHFGS